MTLQIHEQGGLTEAEIKLAIEESAERREAVLDTKLLAHRDEIGKRMDRVEDGVNDTKSRLADLQSKFAVINDENGRQTKLLETIASQGQSWHEDGLKFRQDVIGRVTRIETEQVTLSVQVRKLRVVGAVMYAMTCTLKFCAEKFREADMWKIVCMAVVLYVLRAFAPLLYDFVKEVAK